MAHILADDGKAVVFHVLLHRSGDISDTVALLGKLHALKEALLRHTNEPHSLVGHLTAGIGSGTVAVEAADIALMSDDITKVPYLKRLSNATVNTIKISITLSMCINFLAVALSVLGILNPTTGALVHNAGSCFVVLIAALLYDRKFDT